MKKQLIELFPPQPREVWFVEDSEVRLHSQNRENKKRRPVLVVSSSELTKSKASIINIIPLSTSKKPDKFIFPIKQAYQECFNNFNPSSASSALVQFYQPIEIKFFVEKCGIIDETSYNAIKYILCVKIIGYCDYDLSL